MRSKFKGSPASKVIPSMVTLAALCSGVSAVRSAYLGQYDVAVLFLFCAAVFDGLDGQVARVLHAATEFGAELDSLCDLVDFGVSPALIMYIWSEKTLGASIISDNLLWISSLVFCSACAYRLARFNLSDITAPKPKEIAKELVDYTSSEEDEEEVNKKKRPKNKFIKKVNDAMVGYVTKKKFFQGVPAPVAGGLSLLPMVYHLSGKSFEILGLDGRVAVLSNLILVSCLMVSKIPTFSSKMFVRDPKRETHLKTRSLQSFFLKCVLTCAFFYLLYNYPWDMCFLSAGLYMLSIPVSTVVFYTLPDDKKTH